MINEEKVIPDEEEGVEIPVEFADEEKDPSSCERREADEPDQPGETTDSEETEGAGPDPEEDAGEPDDSCGMTEDDGGSCETESSCDQDEESEGSEECCGEAEDGTEKNQEEDGSAAEETGEEENGQKKSLFGFRKKEKEKEKLLEQIKELNDRLLRSMAEFDNFRKRTEKEKSSMYAMGAEDIVRKILPVVDSFERGLGQAQGNEDPFAEGMRMIYRQLMTALEEAGVEAIDAAGKEFDPNLHNAVMHVDDEELGENIVAEEFQKGYTYKGNVIRHSMVKVAN